MRRPRLECASAVSAPPAMRRRSRPRCRCVVVLADQARLPEFGGGRKQHGATQGSGFAGGHRRQASRPPFALFARHSPLTWTTVPTYRNSSVPTVRGFAERFHDPWPECGHCLTASRSSRTRRLMRHKASGGTDHDCPIISFTCTRTSCVMECVTTSTPEFSGM